MTSHRITYDTFTSPSGIRYIAICTCGKGRTARTSRKISTWAPEHVVAAYEREQRR